MYRRLSQRTPTVLTIALLAFACGTASVADARQSSKLPIRGLVRPVHQSTIAVEIPARVIRLHYREAEPFKKGDVLVTFDCERLNAEYAAADAHYREMKLGLESAAYLDKRGAAGRLDVEVSRARVDKAQAEAASLAARIKQCKLIAPFDGRVSELRINEHEIPQTGQPFISIVDETAFEIDLIVPSYWLKTLSVGAGLHFTVDETGRKYEAKVQRIGAAVDPVSQTVKVMAEFVALDGRVLAGMSGSAVFAGEDGTQ
jgi:RND family efflux transporter MFP subunit